MKSFIAIVMLGILLILATTPMMAASVQGVWIGGNPTCEELGASLGYNWTGMKIDPVQPGSYSDGTLTVEVTVSGKSFDWTSNIPVSAVFVKGGPGGSLYNYEDAESTGDTHLVSVRDTDTKQFGLSHLNFCYDVDLDLTVSKDAQTTYTRTWEWDIEKSVDASQHDLFDGQEATSNYFVDVYKTGYTDSDWLVTGNIWINNPTSMAATIVSVDDIVGDVGAAAVDCGVTFPYDLAPNGDLHCTYSLSLPDSADRLNTVTVSTSGSVNGGSATADVLFGEPSTELYAQVNVEDSVEGYLGVVDSSMSFEYANTFSCSTDEGAHENIATIVETGQTSDATVNVSCYRPEVSKTAETSWSQSYEWSIEKTVDIDLHQLVEGQSGTSNYTVSVYRTTVGSDFLVVGMITVFNPHPFDSLTVDVSDTFSGDIYPELDCGGELNVGPGETDYCYYNAFLPDNTDRVNEAVVSAFGNDYHAYADIVFGEPETEGYPTINVEDSYTGYLGATDEDETYNYSRTFMCDEDEGLHENIATIVETGQTAQADVFVECFGEIEEDLEVSKDAQTSYTRTWEWEIEKSVDTSQHDLFNGQDGTSNYTVEVYKVGYTDSDWLVTGNIWIHNPAPVGATILSVDDIVGDVGAADVDCGVTFPYVLGAGQDLHCTYSLYLPDDSYQLNTVTVTTDGLVGGNSAIADVYFDEPTTEPNAEVNVEDSIVGYLGIVGDYETEFEYSHTFTCPDDEGSNENIATIVETGQTASATVEVTCYAPEVSKTAETSWNATYEWNIEKTVDIDYHQLFEGQSGTSNYTVSVYRTTVGSDFLVTGMITIYNPHPWEPLYVEVSDTISGDIYPELDCEGELYVDPGETEYCFYWAFLPDNTDRVNEAIVTAFGIDYYAYADIIFGEPEEIEGFDTINVEDSYVGYLGNANEDETFTYSRTFVCNEDEGTHPNIATIIETGQSAEADVVVECTEPVDEDLEVSKDAQTSYTRTWEWEIEKSVDFSQHDLFDGQDGTSNYNVNVYKVGYADSDWLVTGNIWIHNPADVDATILSVDDVVSDAGAADVDCGVTFPYVLEAGDDLHCIYSLDLPDDSYRLNTVTVTTDGIVGSNTAIADVFFEDPTTEVNAEVNVEDSLEGYLGIVGTEAFFDYSHTFTCSQDEGLNENIATIVETGQTAQADVTVNCYRPEVSKTAETSWTQTYEWSIQKTVDVAHHQLAEGESGTSTYTVTVDRTAVGSDFFVTGLITIYNPHPWESLTVDVSDTISGDISPELDCGGQLVVDPGETEYCGYGTFLPDNTDRVNEAVVSAFGIDYFAYADVTFGEPTVVGYSSVNVDDTYAGYLGNASDDMTFTYSRTFTCSQDAGTQPNTATIVETGQSASATVTVDCVNQNPPTWCSPGYWKQPHHLDSWPIDPNTLYNDIFDPDLPGNPTLLDVISQPEVYGGPTANMIADYLSSLHPDINFDGTRYEDSCLLN